MKLLHIAAFSECDIGGNPAGVVLCDALPEPARMQAVAADTGYSETVFAAPAEGLWHTRYFSPETQIPFCGHATIALGAALAQHHGPGTYALHIGAGQVSVDGFEADGRWCATLRSPPASHAPVSAPALSAALAGLGLQPSDLDPQLPAARIHAGADHLLLPLHSRARLSAMRYDFEPFQRLMRQQGWVTVALCHREAGAGAAAGAGPCVHARNAFAYGGVYEDPATGAAAAALGGYLRDRGEGTAPFTVLQGHDMGMACRLLVEAEPGVGAPVRVSGTTRQMQY